MAEASDMILPLLREMRQENASLHEQTRGLIQALDRRLGAVEEAQRSYRQALTADTLMSKLLTGEFEERIEALERRVRELETQS
jgi:polyhydroxyalkanoate synthesis regulator phasin